MENKRIIFQAARVLIHGFRRPLRLPIQDLSISAMRHATNHNLRALMVFSLYFARRRVGKSIHPFLVRRHFLRSVSYFPIKHARRGQGKLYPIASFMRPSTASRFLRPSRGHIVHRFVGDRLFRVRRVASVDFHRRQRSIGLQRANLRNVRGAPTNLCIQATTIYVLRVGLRIDLVDERRGIVSVTNVARLREHVQMVLHRGIKGFLFRITRVIYKEHVRVRLNFKKHSISHVQRRRFLHPSRKNVTKRAFLSSIRRENSPAIIFRQESATIPIGKRRNVLFKRIQRTLLLCRPRRRYDGEGARRRCNRTRFAVPGRPFRNTFVEFRRTRTQFTFLILRFGSLRSLALPM